MDHSKRNPECFVDAQFKDCSPEATVQRILTILHSYGIETEEFWRQTSVPYCHALTVRIVGTSFTTNGKGLTPEFARASAYGELMERLQIGAIYRSRMQKDGILALQFDPPETRTPEELLNSNMAWYERIARRLERYTSVSIPPARLLKPYTEEDGTVNVAPFFCLTTGKKEYFPLKMRSQVYTSNGCAAGNTPEEALVQGISEIVERHHMAQINERSCSLPDIPEDVLRSFPTAHRIISHLRSYGYRVTVKDCSLGQKFPVVCVYIIDEKTGRYHTHFGAYPILEIALERALTESFQGYHIDNIARYVGFLYKKPGELSITSITNEMAHGTNEKLLSYFIGTPDGEFNREMGFSGTNNRLLLQECIAYFKEMGLDILARDRSCLGFCTYQIVIPGYSEVFLHRLAPELDEYRYYTSAIRAAMDPTTASLADKLGLIMHLEELKKSPATAADASSFLTNSRISASLDPQQDRFQLHAVLAYIYYELGRSPQVCKLLDLMIPACRPEEAEQLICLKRYLDMKRHGYGPEQIQDLLRYFHRPDTVASTLGGNNPLTPFVVRCDMSRCAHCRIGGACQQKRILELANLINQKHKDLDFEAFQSEMEHLL